MSLGIKVGCVFRMFMSREIRFWKDLIVLTYQYSIHPGSPRCILIYKRFIGRMVKKGIVKFMA